MYIFRVNLGLARHGAPSYYVFYPSACMSVYLTNVHSTALPYPGSEPATDTLVILVRFMLPRCIPSVTIYYLFTCISLSQPISSHRESYCIVRCRFRAGTTYARHLGPLCAHPTVFSRLLCIAYVIYISLSQSSHLIVNHTVFFFVDSEAAPDTLATLARFVPTPWCSVDYYVLPV